MRPAALPAFTATILILTSLATRAEEPVRSNELLPLVSINDNRISGGTPAVGALTVNLRAAAGLWRPEGTDGPALAVEALGEVDKPLQVPAPLLRTREVPRSPSRCATISMRHCGCMGCARGTAVRARRSTCGPARCARRASSPVAPGRITTGRPRPECPFPFEGRPTRSSRARSSSILATPFSRTIASSS